MGAEDLRVWWRLLLDRDGRCDSLGVAGFGLFFCNGFGDAGNRSVLAVRCDFDWGSYVSLGFSGQ